LKQSLKKKSKNNYFYSWCVQPLQKFIIFRYCRKPINNC
jgi:hypothetical protein